MHAGFSVLVAVVVALVVLPIWYPTPYGSVSGGISLLLILIGVDAVLGPLLTAVISDPAKARGAFVRDVAVIVALQIAALSYGLHVLAEARPVILSFEIDRFRLLAANEIQTDDLSQAPPALRRLSWHGPEIVAAAKPTRPEEVLRSIELALNGFDISYFPRYWRPYVDYAGSAWNAGRPMALLLRRYPETVGAVADVAARAGTSMEDLRFVPLQTNKRIASAVIAPPDARVVGIIPVDGFVDTSP